MKTFCTLFLIFSAAFVRAQSFEDLIREADEKYKAKQYAESGQAFDKAFAIGEGNFGQYYNAACSWALAENPEAGIKYLKLSTEKGWKNVQHLKNDKDLENLRSAKGWDEVLAKAQANTDEYEKNFDKPLQKQLEQIYVRDQTLRQLYRDAENKFGKESEEMTYFWKLMAAQDSLNEKEVVGILEKGGWPGISLVGGKANAALWLVIQHAPQDLQEKYLPLLRESAQKGESSGSHLALLEDRILMHRGKPQIYGSQIIPDPETGLPTLYEIFEPEYVNQRRKSVGLGPLEIYVKSRGIEWSVPQKEK